MQKIDKVRRSRPELANGDISFIAEMAGCSRQYASYILSCHPKYKQTGKKALRIWMAYDHLMASKQKLKEEFIQTPAN